MSSGFRRPGILPAIWQAPGPVSPDACQADHSLVNWSASRFSLTHTGHDGWSATGVTPSSLVNVRPQSGGPADARLRTGLRAPPAGLPRTCRRLRRMRSLAVRLRGQPGERAWLDGLIGSVWSLQWPTRQPRWRTPRSRRQGPACSSSNTATPRPGTNRRRPSKSGWTPAGVRGDRLAATGLGRSRSRCVGAWHLSPRPCVR